MSLAARASRSRTLRSVVAAFAGEGAWRSRAAGGGGGGAGAGVAGAAGAGGVAGFTSAAGRAGRTGSTTAGVSGIGAAASGGSSTGASTRSGGAGTCNGGPTGSVAARAFAQPFSASRIASPATRLQSLLFMCAWQKNAKRRAPAGDRLHFQLAVVHLDDAVDHRQADARSMILRREVQVKDLFKVGGRDANACIFDANFDAVAGCRRTNEPERSAVGHRLAAVDGEVEKRLPQHRGVA